MSEGSSSRSPALRWFVLAVKILIIGGLFAYLLREMAKEWVEVRKRIVEVDLLLVAAAVLFQALSMIVLAVLWRLLLGAMGEKLGMIAAARMQWLSALGKYIPGKVSTTLGKICLAHVEGKSPTLVGLGCVYEILFCFVASAAVVLMAVIFGSLRSIRFATVPAAAMVAILVVCVHPRILLPVANWVLKKFRREPIAKAVSYPRALLFAAGYTLPYTLSGVSEFLLLRAFFDVPGRCVIDMMGLTTLGTALGFAVLFAPGGLGVRDFLISRGVSLLVRRPAAGELLAVSARLFGLVMDVASGVISLVFYGKSLWQRRDRQRDRGLA